MKDILIDYMKQFSNLSESEYEEIVKELVLKEYSRGTVLIEQGDIPKNCYFVLKGIVRSYSVDEEGREITFGFYSEQHSINVFYGKNKHKESPYSFMCIEDCVLVVGDLETQDEDFEKNPMLQSMTRSMIEETTDQMQEELASYIKKSPEQLVENIIENRPELLKRVPQYQLASYLGITPESLSRIKKRMDKSS